MSLDVYGFIAECDCCVYSGFEKMIHKPWTEEGIREAQESFGDLWEKYKTSYMFSANDWNRRS